MQTVEGSQNPTQWSNPSHPGSLWSLAILCGPCGVFPVPCGPLRSLAVFIVTLIFGCVSVRVSEFFKFSHAAQTRGHPYKLYRRHSCNNVRSSYFAVRVINVWNSLPADSVDFSSFMAFERTVQQIDFTKFLSCS